jgi:hypothetical protein
MDKAETFNELVRRPSQAEVERQRRDHERLFGPEPQPDDSPGKPQGEADGGKGEPEEIEFEWVQTENGPQRMRVFTDRELYGDNDQEGPNT